jgi:hypothetical protein
MDWFRSSDRTARREEYAQPLQPDLCIVDKYRFPFLFLHSLQKEKFHDPLITAVPFDQILFSSLLIPLLPIVYA